MSRLLTCLACGHEGWDVRLDLVEYPDPVAVDVMLAVAWDRRGRVVGNEVRTVAGRYGVEWRCVDRAACLERAAALPPSSDDVASFFEGVGHG